MTATSGFVRTTMVVLMAAVASRTAEAQLSGPVQKCLDRYNNKLRLVSQQKGLDDRTCIRDAGRGLQPSPNTCVDSVSARVQTRIDKVAALYPGKCTGSEPIQQGAATGSTAHVSGVTNLTHDLFGTPISGAVSPGNAQAQCQYRAIKRATKVFTEKMKVFRACKRSGMRAGTIINSATLAAQCLAPSIPDPTGAISRRVQKLLSDVDRRCSGLALASLFSGLDTSCHGSTAAAGACIEERVECRACETLNASDGTTVDCDLFDNGVADGSCGGTPPVLHKCVLDSSNCTPATNPACGSRTQIHVAALPVPLTFAITGATDIGVGTGTAACQIQNIDPINIPCIGFVCITPGGPCPTGPRHCGPGPGPALGVDVTADANAGVCTNNAHCQTICAGACAPDVPVVAACTAYCSAGAGSACTTDAQCAGMGQGSCNGPDPIGPGQSNVCQCSCLDAAAHGPSDPGDLQCYLSAHLVIENSAPCDGAAVLIEIGDTCFPLSSQRATGLIVDANFVPGATVPPPPGVNDQTGNPIACMTLDASTTTGLQTVGTANFFGSALGDLSVGLSTKCQ